MKNHSRKHLGGSKVLGYRTPSRFVAHQNYRKVSKPGRIKEVLDRR